MAFLSRKKTYDIIYSVGVTCAAATYLNRHFLRVTSGPLDWCGSAGEQGSFGYRMELIRRRFEGFFLKENLQKIDEEVESFCDRFCDLYQDKGSGFYMPHEFPLGASVDELYPTVRAKYDRRIKRFYEKIQQNKRVLLVWITYADTLPDHEQLKHQCRLACESFGKTVDFLLIYNDNSMGLDEPAVKHELAPNIDLWQANIRRKNTGAPLDYLGASHLIDPIFRAYALEGTKYAAVKARIRSRFGRLLSAFIPVRTWRRKVRAHFIYHEFNHDFFTDLHR